MVADRPDPGDAWREAAISSGRIRDHRGYTFSSDRRGFKFTLRNPLMHHQSPATVVATVKAEEGLLLGSHWAMRNLGRAVDAVFVAL